VVPMCFGCFSHMFFDELCCFVWLCVNLVQQDATIQDTETSFTKDRLSGLVVRVPGYRSRGPGFDFRRY
jgi:hypothetical protein